MNNLQPFTSGFGKSLRPKRKPKPKIILRPTSHGFLKGSFIDLYGSKCSIQESSLATDDTIWLGVDDADPQILSADAQKLGLPTTENTGWISYPIPSQVHFTTRMHLNREQVKLLLPILKKFVKNGKLE